MVTASSYGCRAEDASLELQHWKLRCSCSQGVPSFCMGAGRGLNDERLRGGRDGWWLMCRQRRPLLCVSEAYKAASVCDGTESQGTVAQTYRRCSTQAGHRIIFFLSTLCPRAHVVSPLFLHNPSSRTTQQSSVWRFNLI